jgi:hypothetical protein
MKEPAPDKVVVTERAPADATPGAAVVTFLIEPGPAMVATRVVEPVDAVVASPTLGYTRIAAIAEPEEIGTTITAFVEPVPTTSPESKTAYEYVSATVPEGITTVHVTGAATAGWVVVSRLVTTVAATS